MINYGLFGLFATLLLAAVVYEANAEDSKPYRPDHMQTCFEIPGYKIECGNFKLASTILSKEYDSVSAGADVIASFSVESHPGDHPFLHRLAKKLGYFDPGKNSLSNQSIFTWKNLSSEAKNAMVEKYSNIPSAPEVKALLPSYISTCIDYWVHPNAKHDERTQPPTLAEVAALCVADSGVLTK